MMQVTTNTDAVDRLAGLHEQMPTGGHLRALVPDSTWETLPERVKADVLDVMDDARTAVLTVLGACASGLAQERQAPQAQQQWGNGGGQWA